VPTAFVANCSILFTEYPLLDRPAAAAEAGFTAVEFWWPFDSPRPGPSEVDSFVEAVSSAGVRLVALNVFAGDMPGGDRGVLSVPGRQDDFLASVDVAVDIGRRLGCELFNALYGRSCGDLDAERRVALDNLAEAARRVRTISGTLLLEPLSGLTDYALTSCADVVGVIDDLHGQHPRVPAGSVQVLGDLYHLAANGHDVRTEVTSYVHRFGHVQVADWPGRHEPGTGELDLPGLIDLLAEQGYAGRIGLEYQPSGRTEDGLGFLATLGERASA
jgi:hydroxypyruvate isomerase